MIPYENLNHPLIWSLAAVLAVAPLAYTQETTKVTIAPDQTSVELAPSKALPTRDQIADKYKWDLTDIYASNEAWEADFAKVEEMIDRLSGLKGTLVSHSGIVKLKDKLPGIVKIWHESQRLGKQVPPTSGKNLPNQRSNSDK